MNILNKLKQINILNILTILVITFILSLTNNYLSKKPLDLIYKPKPVIEDNLLFGEIKNGKVSEVLEIDELVEVVEIDVKNDDKINEKITNEKADNLNTEFNTTQLNNKIDNKENSNNVKVEKIQEQKSIPNNLETSKNVKDKSVKESTLDNLEKVVNYNQVLKIIRNKNFVIIDARSLDDYKKGKISNALNIFPYNENENEYFQQIMSLPRDKRFLIYCTGGNCDLSHHLAEDMANFGFSNIFIYVGGWEEWEKNSQKK